MVYVVPTSDMLVKSSKHVDPSGECSFDYLDNWRRKSEGCNLRGLVEVMQEHFSRDPPVYAKPKGSVVAPVTRPASGEPSLANRPPPPLPHSISAQPSSTPLGYNRVATPSQQPGGTTGSSGPPALPPKVLPTQQYVSPSGVSPVERSASPGRPPPLPASPFASQSPARPQFPPNPRPPPPIPSPQQSFQQSHNRSNSLAARVASPNHLSASPTSASSSYPSNRWSMPPQPTTHQPPPPPPPLPQSHSQQPPPPPAAYQYQPTPPPPVPLAAPAPTPIINVPVPPAPLIPRPNFLDEDEAPGQAAEAPPSPNAPPRPMNPELLSLHYSIHQKITAELSGLSSALAGDTERLRATQADLLAGEPAIRDEMARLEAVRSVCVTVGDRLNDVVARAEANVQNLKSKGDPEVDELVCSTAIVYNQLIDLIAEDKAIEDTMYHLHRALNSGRIDLDRFIRTVRILAQEQFMKRALIEKINGGLPIGARFHV
ncbi:vacuolar protein sorting-associated protein 23 [Ceratobasidium sp. AG-Ba]|nr:vacuolar protein sorting-associated protein 23 [Ceratobasidium sp. AG-Ba]QRW15228.1 vacuolar protein sorting-associated protein 23 [Ceratobasidium sp. AG-Ba]